MYRITCVAVHFWCVGFFLFVLTVASQAAAQTRLAKVVGNDRGGLIGARAIEIADINAQGARVELRGRICYSSCTMYLGVENLCISPSTTFGFHGPSRSGNALPERQFNHWSMVMAQHYNIPLQNWFMREARHRITGYFQISGSQLIELGYPAC